MLKKQVVNGKVRISVADDTAWVARLMDLIVSMCSKETFYSLKRVEKAMATSTTT